MDVSNNCFDRLNSRTIILFLIITFLLIGAILINLSSGSVDFTLFDLVEVIFGGRKFETLEHNILFKIRIPRILSAIILGAALSVSGFLLQTFFRNPIVGPSILGVTSGARMFVGILILTNFALDIKSSPLFLYFLASMLGSLLTMLVVLHFARKANSISSLVVIGIMVGYIASAVTSFLTTFASEQKIAAFAQWGLGSFAGVNWDMLKLSVLIIVPTIILTFFISKSLQALLLGENYAKSIGVDIKKFRAVIVILSSVLTACVTAFAGPISFVGIAVPHMVRSFFKTSNPKILIPAMTLTGAVFCLISDYFARTLFSPMELNISTITSAIGAPIIIYFMAKGRKL